MQSLQTVILNKVQLGVNPIFIVSPTIGESDDFATLLSSNIRISSEVMYDNYEESDEKIALEEVENDDKSDDESDDKSDDESDDELKTGISSFVINPGTPHNYFVNANITNTFKQVKKKGVKKISGYKDSLKFFVEEGLESGRLWGIACSYKLFFELELDTLFPRATYLITYKTQTSENDFSRLALDFYLKNRTDSFIFHVNNITHLPNLVLNSIPFDSNAILNVSFGNNFESEGSRSLQSSNFDKNLFASFNANNWLLTNSLWYSGSDILGIFLFDGQADVEVILNKIHTFVNFFISFPNINIICKDEEDQRSITNIINEHFPILNIQTIVSNNFAIAANKLVADSECELLIVDDFAFSYSFFKMASPFRRLNPPIFSIKTPDDLQNRQQILLIDVLLKGHEITNIAFSKNAWDSAGGFDPELQNREMLWDFSIRAFQSSTGYIATFSAAQSGQLTTINQQGQNGNSITNNAIFIFDKHIKLYQDNFSKVVSRVYDIIAHQNTDRALLNQKVTAAQSFAAHSNHEAKLLLDLSNSLKARIRALEDKWYYKVQQKISWIKRIFFNKPSTKTGGVLKILKFIIFSFTRPGMRLLRLILKSLFKRMYLLAESRPVKIVYLDTLQSTEKTKDYDKWIRAELEEKVLIADYKNTIDNLKIKPKISILMPVYDPPLHFLKEAIESVLCQTYTNWEFCIADDCSPNPKIRSLLTAYSMRDSRIKVEFRKENGHISASSNSALALATGDYVLLLDHDDLLTQHCLFEVVKHINLYPEDKVIYSDEDKIDEKDIYREPFFKPGWSPDKLLANNYISHVAVIEKGLMDTVKGFRLGYEGSQDYDLMLRTTEQTLHVGHIPKILYHWRIHSHSVAGSGEAKPYAYIAAKKALSAAFQRRNIQAEVLYTAARGSYRIKYHINAYEKVSVIIPTKDAVQLTKNTIDSIYALTTYPNYEIIVLNNNSTSDEFFELMKKYSEEKDNFKCIDAGFPFNFSKLINLGVSHSTGKYVLMLNNDVEVIQKDWMTELVSFSQNEHIGAVGVKLLFPDDTIQHAGVVIGFGPIRVAGHVFLNQHKDAHGYFNQLQTVYNYSAVTAACLMCRRSVFDEVGGMNEDLEVEYNDVDFCLKIREHGYFNVYVPDVVLYHYESATRGHPKENKESYERHVREVNYFIKKWGKYIENDPFYNPNLSLDGNGFEINYPAKEIV